MRKCLKVISLVVVVLLVMIGAVLVKNLVENANKNGTAIVNEETNNYKSIFTKSASDSEQKIDISNIESIDHEIARILFSEYFKNTFNEKLITEAKYDAQKKEFTCIYVMKTYDSPFEKDYVKLITEDFITYQQHKTEYIYNEKFGRNTAHNHGDNFTDISNEAKNRVIALAKSKGYYTRKNLTDKEYERILEIVFDNDKKGIEKTIEKNNYELKNYYLTDERVFYIFVEKDNEENYIEVSSWISGIKGWNVYGKSTKSIHNEAKYLKSFEEYIIDFSIKIENGLDELENIYNTLNI